MPTDSRRSAVLTSRVRDEHTGYDLIPAPAQRSGSTSARSARSAFSATRPRDRDGTAMTQSASGDQRRVRLSMAAARISGGSQATVAARAPSRRGVARQQPDRLVHIAGRVLDDERVIGLDLGGSFRCGWFLRRGRLCRERQHGRVHENQRARDAHADRHRHGIRCRDYRLPRRVERTGKSLRSGDTFGASLMRMYGSSGPRPRNSWCRPRRRTL